MVIWIETRDLYNTQHFQDFHMTNFKEESTYQWHLQPRDLANYLMSVSILLVGRPKDWDASIETSKIQCRLRNLFTSSPGVKRSTDWTNHSREYRVVNFLAAGGKMETLNTSIRWHPSSYSLFFNIPPFFPPCPFHSLYISNSWNIHSKINTNKEIYTISNTNLIFIYFKKC